MKERKIKWPNPNMELDPRGLEKLVVEHYGSWEKFCEYYKNNPIKWKKQTDIT